MEQEQANARTPPGGEKEPSKDILMVLDENEKKLSVLAGDKKEKPGPRKAPSFEENPTEFFQYYGHATWLENFIKNYERQAENPTRWKVIRINIEDIKSAMVQNAEKDLKKGKLGTPAIKKLLDKYEIKPGILERVFNNLKKIFNMADNNLKYEGMVDWDAFQKVTGLTKKDLIDKGEYNNVMNGYRTNKPLFVNSSEGPIHFVGHGILSLQMKDGNLRPKVEGAHLIPDLSKTQYGAILPVKVQESLLLNGYGGQVVEADPNDGKGRRPCLFSISPTTNKLHCAAVEDIYIAPQYGSIKIDGDDKEHFLNGGALKYEDVEGKNGTYDTLLFASAEKKRIESRFLPRAFNGQKIGDRQLTDQQKRGINNSEWTLVEKVMYQNADFPVDRYYRVEPTTGKLETERFNPSLPEEERKVCIPYGAGKHEFTPEERMDLEAGKEVYIPEYQSQNGDVNPMYYKVDQLTGQEIRSRTVAGLEQSDGLIPIPQEVLGNKVKGKNRDELQTQGFTFMEKFKLNDGTVSPRWLVRDQRTGRTDVADEDPTKKMDQSKDQKEAKTRKIRM